MHGAGLSDKQGYDEGYRVEKVTGVVLRVQGLCNGKFCPPFRSRVGSAITPRPCRRHDSGFGSGVPCGTDTRLCWGDVIKAPSGRRVSVPARFAPRST